MPIAIFTADTGCILFAAGNKLHIYIHVLVLYANYMNILI